MTVGQEVVKLLGIIKYFHIRSVAIFLHKVIFAIF
jgi:hypothetical protein